MRVSRRCKQIVMDDEIWQNVIKRVFHMNITENQSESRSNKDSTVNCSGNVTENKQSHNFSLRPKSLFQRFKTRFNWQKGDSLYPLTNKSL
jgi:hypothetical protein